MGSMRINCWEAKCCGREPRDDGGSEMDICPVFDALEYDGVNDGQYGGRFCWVVAGTLCEGRVQGEFAQKFIDCMSCDFYALVVHEQGVHSVVVNPMELGG